MFPSFFRSVKNKIVNDPVWGFIDLKEGLMLDIIAHPWYQRLRRIKQLGLSSMVYPGANHTRFEHAIGTTHLLASAACKRHLHKTLGCWSVPILNLKMGALFADQLYIVF